MASSDKAVNFEPVTARADAIVIAASGPSTRNIDDKLFSELPDCVHVVAVNRAVQWLPVCHSFFTLDPDDRILPLMENRRDGVSYYAAVPDDYGTPDARVKYHRRAPVENIHYLRRLHGDGVLKSRPRLAEEPSDIHTGNSAFGALGLAYHMRPKRIVLIGIDADARQYGRGAGKPRTTLHHLPGLFATSLSQLKARGIEVRNGSQGSLVKCFTRLSAVDAFEWISQGG